MRVSEETFSLNWVGMGWWVSGGCLWVRTTPSTTNISLLSHARQRRNLVLRWLGVYTGRGSINISISVNCKQQQVPKINNTKKRRTTTPITNIYFIVKPCTSAQKPRVTVGRCVRRGREVIMKMFYISILYIRSCIL